jgi:hypothetical protein
VKAAPVAKAQEAAKEEVEEESSVSEAEAKPVEQPQEYVRAKWEGWKTMIRRCVKHSPGQQIEKRKLLKKLKGLYRGNDVDGSKESWDFKSFKAKVNEKVGGGLG